MGFKRVVQIIGYPIIRIFYRIRISGKEHFLKEGPFVLCPNHTSNMDVPVLYLSVNRPLNFMAKEELFHFKPFGWIISKLGAFPVKRESGDLQAFKSAMKVLKNGEVLAVFPQGKRTHEIDVEEAKAGAVLIASKARVPIVPVSITGGYRLGCRINIHFGEPYVFPEDLPKKLSNETIREIAEEIMLRIKRLSEETDE